MASGIARTGTSGLPARARARLVIWRLVVWHLVKETVATCFRYRVTGLAAEAGFFALLSLPPLALGLVGSVGYLGNWIGQNAVKDLQARLIEVAGNVLTASSVRDVIKPTLADVFDNGRFDLISIGFLLALWSGSRALNVFIDTISIMYGLGGVRGIIRTRLLSFSLYVVALVIGAVVVPLVLVGPTVLADILPKQVSFLNALYWPVAPLLTIVSLTSLYHVAAPLRTPWRRDVPGALLTLTIWFGGSYVLRWMIALSVGGTSIYGPLAAPIVLMIWLYVLAIAVLIGAALNAAVETLWPVRDVARARAVVAATEPATLARAAPGDNPAPNRSPAENPLATHAEQR